MAKKLTKKELAIKKRVWDDYLKDCVEEIKKEKYMKVTDDDLIRFKCINSVDFKFTKNNNYLISEVE